jgi:phospholipid/cholesterol/gamma-HCH transport system substrate-binding protein
MRRLSRQDFETIIGAAAMAAVVLILWLASAQGKASEAASGYIVTGRFDQVDGLSVGNPVYISGIRVGTVEAIGLAPGTLKPVVSLNLRYGVPVPRDSAALIMSDGVLGGKFVRIEPGSDTETMKAGDRFQMVQDSVIVEQILQKIVQGAEARFGKKKTGDADKAPQQR